MQLAEDQQDLLSDYLDGFRPLIGDRCTQALFHGTIEGIIGAPSLVGSKVATCSPRLATQPNAEQRIRRMAKGATTKRSDLDA